MHWRKSAWTLTPSGMNDEMATQFSAADIAALRHFDEMNSVHSLGERAWALSMEEAGYLKYHGGSCDGSRSYVLTDAGRAVLDAAA
jgi:hypothetical protein